MGTVYGSTSYDFGDSQTVLAPYASGSNAVLVKYNASGNVQWAKSLSSAADESEFLTVAVDSSGSIFVGGDVYTSGTFTFGSVTASGGYATGWNSLLVKYNAFEQPSGRT